MCRVQIAPLCALVATLACAGTVDPRYYRTHTGSISAAGIHGLTFSVEVEDAREGMDAKDLGRPSARSAATIVRTALAGELASHDLEVVERRHADVWLEVVIHEFEVFDAPTEGPLFRHRRAQLVATLRVGAFGQSEALDERPIRRRADLAPRVLDINPDELALEAVLERFVRRAAHHPSVLIAFQAADRIKRAEKP